MDFSGNRISFDPDVDAGLLAVDLSFAAALDLIRRTARELQANIDLAYEEEAVMAAQSSSYEANIPFGATCQVVELRCRIDDLAVLQQNVAGLALGAIL